MADTTIAEPSASRLAPESAIIPPEKRRLRGSLGTASIVFIVVAAASPLGVIGGPVPLGIAFGNGAGFPFTFIVVTAVLLLFAVGFTDATPLVKSAGAFFAYVDKGLGRGAGLGAAFAALLSYVALEAGVFGLLGPAANGLFTSYGAPDIPWWVYAAVAFAVVSALGLLQDRALGPRARGAARRRGAHRARARRGRHLRRRRTRGLLDRHLHAVADRVRCARASRSCSRS